MALSASTSILIVEDETAIRELVAFVLETDGYRTLRAGSVSEAKTALAKELPDLILLDCMLPDRSGLSWLKEVKSNASDPAALIPVILLTACGDEMDRVKGLDAGADDYIVKPFLPRELTARIRAALRRRSHAEAGRSNPADNPEKDDDEAIVACGPLVMNEARFEASVEGVPLKLSAKEFKLLHLFASKPGRVFSRETLLEAVWQSAFVDERTVDVHMLRLRKALAGTAAESLIETVRGVGYRCRAEGRHSPTEKGEST